MMIDKNHCQKSIFDKFIILFDKKNVKSNYAFMISTKKKKKQSKN